MSYTSQKNQYDLPLFPGLLPYPHSIGAPSFRATDPNTIKNGNLLAMSEQIKVQKEQILSSVRHYQKMYEDLIKREAIAYLIYNTKISFQPVPGQIYHLYQNNNDLSYFLSLISPTEWGNKNKILFVATIKLLFDLTWQIEDSSEELQNFITNQTLLINQP